MPEVLTMGGDSGRDHPPLGGDATLRMGKFLGPIFMHIAASGRNQKKISRRVRKGRRESF